MRIPLPLHLIRCGACASTAMALAFGFLTPAIAADLKFDTAKATSDSAYLAGAASLAAECDETYKLLTVDVAGLAYAEGEPAQEELDSIGRRITEGEGAQLQCGEITSRRKALEDDPQYTTAVRAGLARALTMPGATSH